ncbi:glycoside hydrolase family 127 protein [Naasia sp. SYSU D00948]|uniref:glycoside hydrolase family 127 protein n=1 Tax=Naasia sp. SYSU D00948 TaxID=2817379 RepID=UPI001B30F30C|nr:beta-L-arabinofuranosidase domain-containing protein [Naasia sp. SYSU D00948]
MTTTTSASPHTTLTPLGAANVRWSGGFWGGRLEQTRSVTVPSIWGSLSTPEVSPGWRNFLIAAGRADGEHEGPPFLDGDLYKWLEAAILLLETGPDPELERVVDEVAALVAEVQREDGYVHTPTIIAARRRQEAVALADRFNFETYNLGHLITAGVRHHRLTGSNVLLDVARKAAGFLEGLAENHRLQLAESAICPSHYMAVMDLYRVTGEDRYLRLAEAFVQVRDDFHGGDDNQDRIPVREQKTVAGHAVRANYLYAGLADLVAETGDADLRGVLENLWHDVVDTKLYITGGCGALYDGASPDGYPWQREISRVHQAYGRAYQLPHTTAHNESCANIGMILWSERMLALTGSAEYADVIEQVAVNSLLAGISLDGTKYFYTNPLRQVRDLPYPLRMPGETAERPTPEPPPSDERLRASYMSVFCCPPNIARTLARSHELAMSTSGDALWVHLYGDAEADVSLEDGRSARLRIESEQPWDERVRITVTEAASGGVPLRLRIPAWAEGATVEVNGGTPEPAVAGAYAPVDRDWQAGDTVELTLPLRVRLRRGHRLAEELAGQVAVTRGPVVYALESHELPEGVRLEQVALRRGATFTPVDIELEGQRLVALDGEAVVLPTEEDEDLYPDVEGAGLRTVPVRLIPYFAWGNRGPSEMSVWLPLVWG